ESWRQVERDGETWTRELNTMPQWAGSCWYYLRFCDPHNDDRFVGEEAERYWMNPTPDQSADEGGLRQAPMGVDLYVGGVEHAVLHLLYARFWHKVLYDLGHVSTPEPFGRLFNQGYIQGYYYEKENGVRVPADKVVNADGRPASEVQGQDGQSYFFDGEPVNERFGKMGKSLKNAINPDDMCEQYGCDSLRLYEMYLGPLDQSKPWRTDDIVGVHRFLQRLWRNLVDEESGDLKVSDDAPDDQLNALLHRTIERVTDDMERLSYNTAIAALIELNNALVQLDTVPRAVAEPLVLLLAPMAPHITEELWRRLGHEETLARAPWPEADPDALVQETVELPVQVNGKVRGHIDVPADADQDAIEAAAREAENVQEHLAGKEVRKVIVVPGRLVNIVAN
ncbi:MAG: class I tRNA ligase family protein, partial [Phycisphaeraceae bacterium]|nr:class I tRNA ligase family protein [Phycisphaeraceae bacterium]